MERAWCGLPFAGQRARIGALLVAGLLVAGAPVAQAGNANPGIAPIQSRPHGHTYGEWAASWWRWVVRAPAAVHPVLDETGANCAVGQSGSVWFLAGNFGGQTHRECTVPAGQALFVPLANWVWLQFLTDPAYSIEEIRAQNKMVMDDAQVAAEIDGRPVVLPGSYREASPVFTAELPLDNFAGIGPEQCALGERGLLQCHPSLDDGIYLFLHPLTPGDHTLHFAASIPLIGFSLDVTYTLHVAEP